MPRAFLANEPVATSSEVVLEFFTIIKFIAQRGNKNKTMMRIRKDQALGRTPNSEQLTKQAHIVSRLISLRIIIVIEYLPEKWFN